MLHYSTISSDTLNLLHKIQKHPAFDDFILAGGTGLALQIGHRISIDLDFFKYSVKELQIRNTLNSFGQVSINAQTNHILQSYINEIKVDFVAYPYSWIVEPISQDNVQIAAIEDIAAMKLAAITNRGTRKDFVDLHFILKQYSLNEILSFYDRKFSDGSQFMVYRSLTYFEDADLDPMPQMLIETSWERIKKNIIHEVRTYFP